jgi:flagellar protein FliO/FliZ
MKNIILCALFLFFSFNVVATESEAIAPVNTVSTADELKGNSEEMIPLKLNEESKNNQTESTSQKITLTIGLLIVMVGAGYYGFKRFVFNNKAEKSNRQIKVLSQHYLGPKKSLAIIRVAGESILIGVTDQNISMIKSLALIDDEIPNELPQNFQENFQSTIDAKKSQDIEADEFSVENLSTTISQKIKSMRNIQ